MRILNLLQQKSKAREKSLAVLIDPDKVSDAEQVVKLVEVANENYLDFFFVGGSLITAPNLSMVIHTIKKNTSIPVILFPGSNMHIDTSADAILFLSLISGRNPELLIGQHVIAAPIIRNSQLETLPTGYMLVSSGKSTSVSYMSNTIPIPADKYSIAASTAMAGEMLGLKLIYMDAGSGGVPISSKMISKVRRSVNAPLIVGGGISTVQKAVDTLNAGADTIVIGNAIEENPDLLIEVSAKIYDINKDRKVQA